ncbi:MAG: cytochrome c [Alphaproteobacteria bacterium]|nr:cytochrome c [Alphaproteobacteria bacterium]
MAGCAACHTDEAGKGPPLAGGRQLKTPFGDFFSPNITPHIQTGIGSWTDKDFIAALRRGVAPDGSHYFPAFPYPSYTAMTARDMRDIKAYLFSLPPIQRVNKPHNLTPPFGWRFLVSFWKLLFFDPGPFQPEAKKSESWNRGAYLAIALGHCGECHTPRNPLGAVDQAMLMAGTREGPEGGTVPNITPHPETGIGEWSEDDLDTFLSMGMLPDGDFVGGQMADVVLAGTSRLTPADRKALIEFLRTLPATQNNVATGPGG